MGTKKNNLTKSVAIFSSIGICLIFYAFMSSLGENDRTKNNATITVSVSDMVIGEVRSVEGYFFLYKSADQEYVLMNGWAPYKGCAIAHFESGKNGRLFDSAYQDQPHFYEECDGALWNLKGELLEGGSPLEQNMVRRRFQMIDNEYILFDRSQS